MSTDRRSFTVARGKVTEKSKCWIGGLRVRCQRQSTWLVFPRGKGTLDTTQLSNLSATPCDNCLLKAIKHIEKHYKESGHGL